MSDSQTGLMSRSSLNIIIIIIVLIIIIYPMVLWSSLIGLLYKSRSFYFVRLEFSLLEHLLAAKRVTLVDR